MTEPTPAQINSACLSFDHSFGLLKGVEREQIIFCAREWLRAWQKEGIGADRNEIIERCACVVDQANREGPYQAIAAASRIRALKDSSDPQLQWQPIETAPKDGTWIIVRCNDHSRLYLMSWGRARDGEMWWCTSTNSYGEGLFNCGGGWIPAPQP
ncbi:hypothetical protein [Bradyrhizobium sp.]